jgi:hypothetical protein
MCHRQRINRVGTTALAVLLVSSTAWASLIVTNDRAVFLSSNPIESTETFDGYSSPTWFPVGERTVTIDQVVYVDSQQDPAWALEPVSNQHSAPNALLARLSLEDKVILFAVGGYVHAIGWSFIPMSSAPGEDARFRFVVQERDLTSTEVPWAGMSMGFVGLSSNVGIRSILVHQERVDGVRTNYAFDDVSRTRVIPEPTAALSMGIGVLLFLLRGVHNRRKEVTR